MARSEVPVRILPAGDSAWLIELPERIDILVNAQAIRIAHNVEAAGLPVTDVVVGYRSVMVYIDPLSAAAAGIERRLEELVSRLPPDDAEPGAREVTVREQLRTDQRDFERRRVWIVSEDLVGEPMRVGVHRA